MNNQSNAIKTSSSFTTLRDDSRPSKLALDRYMDQYQLSHDDKEATVNFIRAGASRPARFYVPDDAIPQMMDLLNDCYRDGVTNHLLEIQDVNEISASALFFQFEFQSEQSKIEFSNVIPRFITILFTEVLSKFIAFPQKKEEHYCFCMSSYASEQDNDYDYETLKFNSTFRLMIPSIMLTRDVRFFIYQRVWQSVGLKDLFERKLNYRFRDCFKRSMRTAPVSLLGSCDAGKRNRMILESVHLIDMMNGKMIDESCQMTNVDNRFKNLVNEVSVNYPLENGIVFKGAYDPNAACQRKMQADCTDDIMFQMAYDDAYSDFVQQQVVDKEVRPVYKMVCMLKNNRFETVEEWMKVIHSLASKKDRYKCIAIMMTKDRARHLIRSGDITWDGFLQAWDASTNSSSKMKHSTSTLQYWASCDSPSQLQRYVNKTIRDMLVHDIRDALVEGKICHSHIARYIAFKFKNSFITRNMSRSSTQEWYEFVTPSTHDRLPGQLYKWRCIGNYPDQILMYISEEFKDIASIVFNDLKSYCSNINTQDKEDPRIKYTRELQKNFKGAIKSIYNHGFKRSVVDEATGLFKNDSFITEMDQTTHIMGVGNGVVEFDGPNVRLIKSHHNYPISLFTSTNYVPYDENSKYVKTVYRMLHSLVPDDEMDALEFLLYYLSTSLDWEPKESLFFIIHGGGSNGKTAILELFRLTLGGLYARKMPLSFITDQNRTRSSSADPAVMELKNARLVYYSESDRNEKVNVAKVKEITGGETLSGRQLYKEQENFRVNCNHIVTTNHRFVIETTEHAVWRRFISYKFKICFKHEIDPSKPYERKRDPELINTIMKDSRYHSAFLSILVHYRSKLYSEYGGQILKVPHPTIIRETDEYRQSEDIFQRFIMQRVYYYNGIQQSMEEFAGNFRNFYRVESNDVYKGKSQDLAFIFKNSCIGKYFVENGGIFKLENFYAPPEGETPHDGSVLFSKWIHENN